MQSTD